MQYIKDNLQSADEKGYNIAWWIRRATIKSAHLGSIPYAADHTSSTITCTPQAAAIPYSSFPSLTL